MAFPVELSGREAIHGRRRAAQTQARHADGDGVHARLLPLAGARRADLVLDGSGNYVGVADYKEEFSKLWKVT